MLQKTNTPTWLSDPADAGRSKNRFARENRERDGSTDASGRGVDWYVESTERPRRSAAFL